jgi:F0F1-type ATP synthase assembly protein I
MGFSWILRTECVAQIVPAVLLMIGMVNGVASVVKEEMATAKAKK